MDTSALFGLLLTSLAGLATGIGSAVALFARRGARSFLAASLGFSAGVMVYVSFVELLPTATLALGEAQGAHLGPWIATGKVEDRAGSFTLSAEKVESLRPEA